MDYGGKWSAYDSGYVDIRDEPWLALQFPTAISISFFVINLSLSVFVLCSRRCLEWRRNIVSGAITQDGYENTVLDIGGPRRQQRRARMRMKVSRISGRKGKWWRDLRALASWWNLGNCTQPIFSMHCERDANQRNIKRRDNDSDNGYAKG